MLQQNFATWIKTMAQEQVQIIKRELEKSLERAVEMQNPLNNLVQD